GRVRTAQSADVRPGVDAGLPREDLVVSPGPPSWSRRDELLPLLAEPFDADLHRAPFPQVGDATGERYSLGGAGVDEVARIQNHVLGQVVDDLRNAEDHVRRRGVLPDLTVDSRPQQIGRAHV